MWKLGVVAIGAAAKLVSRYSTGTQCIVLASVNIEKYPPPPGNYWRMVFGGKCEKGNNERGKIWNKKGRNRKKGA
jgi:hypothetical protein